MWEGYVVLVPEGGQWNVRLLMPIGVRHCVRLCHGRGPTLPPQETVADVTVWLREMMAAGFTLREVT